MRNEIERRTVTTRNYRNFELDKFRKDLKFQWTEKDSLCELAEMYRSVASEFMDKRAPRVTERVTKRKCELWFNDQIINQEHIVRTSEEKMEEIRN